MFLLSVINCALQQLATHQHKCADWLMSVDVVHHYLQTSQMTEQKLPVKETGQETGYCRKRVLISSSAN